MSESFRQKNQSRQSADWMLDDSGEIIGLVGPRGDIVTPVTVQRGPDGGNRFLTAGGLVVPVPAGLQGLSVGCLGDSITKQCFDTSSGYGASTGDAALSTYGWLTWWQFFSRANLNFTQYAVSGATSANVLTLQLDAALAAKHDVYTLAPIGINDAVTGPTTVANVTEIVERIVKSGARVLLGTPTPTNTYSTSAGRIATIMAGMRALAIRYPLQVRLVDFNRLGSDPNSADGAAYQTTFDDGTYDTTHPAWLLACAMGCEADRATRDWTAPYIFPLTRGDSGNLLPNGQFGGTTGTITNAGTNSVAPDGFTASRGGASVTYSMFKARRLPLVWKTGVTYPIGARITPPVPNGMHYIVLTSAATGSTAPSATVVFGQTTPDAGGPLYLTVPANDDRTVPVMGEDLLVLGSSTGLSAADHCGVSNTTIDATGFVGKTIKSGVFVESLGSIWPIVQMRVDQHDSGGNRISGAFGMMVNSLPGSSVNPYATLGRNQKGLVATPKFTVAANCATLRLYLRAYQPGNGYQTAILLSDAFFAEVA